jgi:hypothetical protein
MMQIASKPWLMQAHILLDMHTALGIIFLGVISSGKARSRR